MLWGCVTSADTGNLVKVKGHMDSTQYHQILENNVQESYVMPELGVPAKQQPETLLKIY